jgi:DNA-binding NarL/FixJ family response regulator
MMQSNIIKIIVAEQQKLVKEGVINLLNTFPNFLVIDEAENGRELIEKSVISCPDLIITDIDLSPISGIEAVTEIIKLEPKLKILFFTNYVNENQIHKVFRIGYYSIISKNISVNEFVYAINLVMSGENYFSREFSNDLIETLKNSNNLLDNEEQFNNSLEQLSKREEEIVFHLASGLTTQEIAERLFISKRTVDTHRIHIIQKFNLRSSAELFKFAYKYTSKNHLQDKN